MDFLSVIDAVLGSFPSMLWQQFNLSEGSVELVIDIEPTFLYILLENVLELFKHFSEHHIIVNTTFNHIEITFGCVKKTNKHLAVSACSHSSAVSRWRALHG